LEGGILGRVDDMFIVRGNNVFPTAVEAVLRRFEEIAEFRCEIISEGAMAQVKLEIEAHPELSTEPDLCERVAKAVQGALSFRPEVKAVPTGSLPRFEMKAKRFLRKPAATAQKYRSVRHQRPLPLSASASSGRPPARR
jgi:phenylacetate-CoA ligase